MRKIKGKKMFNYNSIKSQMKMFFSKPESNDYTIDFSELKYNVQETLSDIAEEKNIYIGTIADNNLQNENIYKAIPKHFNSLTCENAMKWGHLTKGTDSDDYDFSMADKIVEFATEKGVSLRGHALIWGRVLGGSYPAIVDKVVKESDNPSKTLETIMENHIKTVMERYSGKIRVWDVVNEPFEVFGENLAKYSFFEILGKDYIKKSFIWANQYRTTEKLALNEQFFCYKDQRAMNFINLLKEYKAEGIPIDVIGLQHHIMFNEPKYDDMRWFLDEITKLGYHFELTEVDVRQAVFKKAEDKSLAQAQCYYSIAKLCMEYDEFDGITIWGLDDGYNWYDAMSPFDKGYMGTNAPLLFDSNFCKKPCYYGLLHGIISK